MIGAVVVLLSAALSGLVAVEAVAVGPYYPPIVHYGVPGPASNAYIVPAYLPQYGSYRVGPSPGATSYYNGQQNNEQQQQQRDQTYEQQQQDKYYYGGKFQGTCSNDGLYYKDDTTFVICSNGYPSEQPCPPGTKTSGYPTYQAGYYYGYTDLCSVNLVDYGYGPASYVPSAADYSSETKESTQAGYKSTSYANADSKKDNKQSSYSASRGAASATDDYQPSQPSTYSASSSGSYASGNPGAVVPRDAAGYEIKEAYYHSEYPATVPTSSYVTKNSYPSRDSYSPSSSSSVAAGSNPYIVKDAAYSPSSSSSSSSFSGSSSSAYYPSSDDYVPSKSPSYLSKDTTYGGRYETKDTVYSPRDDYNRVTYPTKGTSLYPTAPSKRY